MFTALRVFLMAAVSAVVVAACAVVSKPSSSTTTDDMANRSSQRVPFPTRLGALVAALAIVAAACSASTPSTEPPPPTTSQTTSPSLTPTTAFSESPGSTLPPPNPVGASVTLAEEDAVTATIGAGGGTIETVGSDGYRYVLTVPSGALLTDVEVTMTPIADLTSEVVDRFIGGVQFAPEGLIFTEPATLRIDGMPATDAMAFSYRGDGEDLAFMPLLDSDGTPAISVYHFSGAGAGVPSGSAATQSSGSQQARIVAVAYEEFIEEGACISQGGDAWKTITDEQQRFFREEVIPALIEARSDDEVLWDAMLTFLNWIWANMSLEEYGLVCDPEAWSGDLTAPDVTAEALVQQGVDLEELGIDAGQDVDGMQVAVGLLTAGLEYAIGNAGRLCAETHDLGELRYVAGWAEAAVYAGLFVDSGDFAQWEASWQRLMASEIERCLRFEFQFDSYIEVEDDPLVFAATMRSTVEGITPGVNLELIGAAVESYWASAPMTYAPRIELRMDQGGCDVHVRDYSATDLNVMLPQITVPDPQRAIKLPTVTASTTGEDEQIGIYMERLDGSEFFDAGCGDLGGPNTDGAWGPWTFNMIHEDALRGDIEGNGGGPTFFFPLEPGPGKLIGRLTFQRDLNMEGTAVHEETTMNLIHTPAPGGE